MSRSCHYGIPGMLLTHLGHHFYTMLPFLLLVLVPPGCASEGTPPHHYIVLRVANLTNLWTTSAVFELTEPKNETRPWDCESGPNPISYNSTRPSYATRAKSIDLERRTKVKCLGFTVLLVEKRWVSTWIGDQPKCQGLEGSTSNYEVPAAKEADINLVFKFIPKLEFDVYNEEPSAECAKHDIVLVQPPRVSFTFTNGTLSGCEVISFQADLLYCNMSISMDNGDVVSMATGATKVYIPQFVTKIPVLQIECKCQCNIKSNETSSGARTDSVVYNGAIHQQNETITTEPSLLSSDDNSAVILILVYVLAFLFVVSTIMTIVFLHVSRRLHKRLHKVLGDQRTVLTETACGHPASRCRLREPRAASSATAPPACYEGHYSTLHRFRNECHHYNTVSLRLSDCIELGRKVEEKPIYQKLNFNEIEEYSTTTSV